MTARIITIGREYGSGGRSIGEQAAKMLGYGFYDKVLIDLAAKKSGFAIDYIRNTEEQVTPNYLFNLAANGYYANSMFINDGLPASDNLFILQSKIIRELAEKEPCVIVGRCADYILRDRTDCLNVFIHAPLADRVARAVGEYGLPAEGAEKPCSATTRSAPSTTSITPAASGAISTVTISRSTAAPSAAKPPRP